MKKIIVFILPLFFVSTVVAQRTVTLAKENIPRLPVDTLPTNRSDVRLVTFTDGTFRFIPADEEQFRSKVVYAANWDTVQLFAYRSIELADLPALIALEITDSLGAGFHAPVTGKVLSKYGPRGRRAHNGTDIQVVHGQPIFATFDGIVRLSRWNSGGFGNLVIIRHSNGLETYYGHLSRRAVKAGDWVAAGQVIGYGGRTGRASGNHLHFETRYSDQSFDAERLVNFETGKLRLTIFALKKDYFSIRSRAVEGIDDNEEVLAAADSLATADSLAMVAEELSKPVYHTIKSGDTLLAIARNYGTTTTEICRLNGITRDGVLRIGKRLRIK
jgi:murein DD-endopeptidase MepM/ murein hydrolase activator NlpD